MGKFVLIIFTLSLAGSLSAQPPELLAIIKADTINTRFGKRIEPLGDQNNDGYDDILVADLTGRAFLYYGRPVTDTIKDHALMFDSITYFMNNVGDVNGDDFDDFTLPRYVSGTGRLDLYYGGLSIDTVPDQWFIYNNLYGKGYSSFGFDYDFDGISEIISSGSESWSALFYELTQPFDSVEDLRLFPANLSYVGDYDDFANNPIVGFFNEDTTLDLAIGLKKHMNSGERGSIYFYWGGPSFDTIPDLIIGRPGGYIPGSNNFGGAMLECLGDLNNDGFTDIFASSSAALDDSVGFIFFGGPNLDTIPDITIKEWHSVARTAGDVNNDGFDDLILGHPLPWSGSGEVYIYYGGTDMDSIPDITFTNSAFPGYQTEFGFDCSGVGDFNGDSINDYAFSLERGGGWGLVYIYSGTDMSSPVDYEYNPTLPLNFTLSQNYPNPFNPETTIEFALPNRSQVELAIYNVLGQQVKKLINKSLSAGTYTISWDGRDDSGIPVASGIYFYKLITNDIHLSKKMVLLK